jgi:glyoxylase-like metal-dependent hydrolase (beta-lactamase superfamily II)
MVRHEKSLGHMPLNGTLIMYSGWLKYVMVLKRKIMVMAYLLIMLPILACHGQVQGAYPVKVRKINDKVIVCNCFGVNVAVIATRKGLVIIDTDRSPGIMQEIRKAIKKEFGRDDFLYVINTHGHWDHASGNQVFPDSIIIGHEKCPEFMKRNPATALTTISSLEYRLSIQKNRLPKLDKKSDEAKALADDIRGLETLIRDLKDNYSVTPPRRTFADSMTLDAGDMTLKLLYCGNAHTNNDIFIYVPEQKMLFSGDIFSSRSSFSFGVNVINDIPRVIAAIDRVLSDGSGVEYIITGHGQSDMSGSDLKNLGSSLQEQYLELDSTRSAALVLKKLLQEHNGDKAIQKYKTFRINAGNRYYFSENEFTLLAWQLLWTGSVDKAIHAFRTTVEEFPASALAYDNLAEAFMQHGNADSAVYYYKRSLQFFPGNTNAQEILKLLGK